MTTETRMSELDAINTMISCIGETPVSSLETSGSVSVAIAKQVLDEISRAVQEMGWHFNSEEAYPMARNVDNEIPVAPNVVRVDPTAKFWKWDAIQRGDRMYSRYYHTYVFTEDLECDVVWVLPWTDIPQAVRHYIAIRASRVFQARVLGSETQYKFSADEEVAALNAARSADSDASDHNMLTDSWSVWQIVDRPED